jgi:hypothetical protein
MDNELNQACIKGCLETVKRLVSNGADVHFENDAPVRYASDMGHLDIIKYLVSVGANVRAADDHAVELASFNYFYEVVQYLVSVGANRALISPDCDKYIEIYNRSQQKIRERAQKKIYFWWIPICYDIRRECGQRMKVKNWQATEELFNKH